MINSGSINKELELWHQSFEMEMLTFQIQILKKKFC